MSRLFSVAVSLLLVLVLAGPATGTSSQPEFGEFGRGDDVHVPVREGSGGLVPQATDPLGLLSGIDTLRDHSLGEDVLEVWTCGLSASAGDIAAELESSLGGYFEFHSRGRYDPVFVPRGSAGSVECEEFSQSHARPNANGAIHVTPNGGGFASPGWTCGFTPCPDSQFYGDGNGRSAFVGRDEAFHSTAAHEMGHMIQWPHSYTGEGDESDFSRQYDDALDVMSGNYGVDSGLHGYYPEPYATSAVNRYAAGWIDPHEVYVFSGGGASFDLATAGGTGYRMAVIRAGGRFFALGARIPSRHDPIPDYWAGVDVYEVTICEAELECFDRTDMRPGFRRVRPHPAVPFDFYDFDSYYEALPHVIRPGTARTVAGVRVEVGAIDGQEISVAIGPSPQSIGDPSPPVPFFDAVGHVFADDIQWLAAAGVTKGCNPPANDRFCPDEVVTRGQMAAFLHRALPDLAAGASPGFSDDDGSVFETDIEWLAATGVTKGCNPPVNDRFCPDEPVTRGAMAAFLHRALGG